MLLDAQGLDVTTDSLESIHAINKFTEQLLGYGKDVEVIFQGVEADPDGVLANAHAAALHLFAETADAPNQAAPFLQRAIKSSDRATERERLYVKAIAAWSAGQIKEALEYHEELATRYPQDIISVKIGQYHYFNLGDSQGLLSLIEKVLPANLENHYIHGMLAFGLAECRCLEAAERAGRQATKMNRQDPWAHHAVAHVLESQGRLDEGIAWMESVADTWENCGAFYTHNWSHIALYYLDKENFAKVLSIYDDKIWGRATQDSGQCHLDAIAILLRLELRGIEVGDRWRSLGDYVLDHIHDHVLPLIDVQFIYALVRSGHEDKAQEMFQSIQSYIETAKADQLGAQVDPIQFTWTKVTLPTAEGMLAHAVKDWSVAVANLGAAIPHLHKIGGSHAQRDLFEQVYIDALIQSGEYRQAQTRIEQRARVRHQIPLVYRTPSIYRGKAYDSIMTKSGALSC
jgi:tetratricopeptide (TPR) repeat protein